MALIEDFDNLAKDYLIPKQTSSPENKSSENHDDKSSDTESEEIIVLSEDILDSSSSTQSNISESLIPGIGLAVDIDSGSDDLEVMIIDEPMIIDPPLDGILEGDIDQSGWSGDDDDVISIDPGDINIDEEIPDYIS